jgi:hypothetical protein
MTDRQIAQDMADELLGAVSLTAAGFAAEGASKPEPLIRAAYYYAAITMHDADGDACQAGGLCPGAEYWMRFEDAIDALAG